MTDRLLQALAGLDDPSVGAAVDAAADRADRADRAGRCDPARLADRALHLAGRRRQRRRATAAVATPLVAAAAAVAVALLPGTGLAGLLLSDGVTTPAGRDERAPWGDAERVEVLLVGSDAAPGRDGWDADSVVLASIDPRTGDTLLVGVPRNRLGVRGPDGRWRVDPDPRVAPVAPQVEALTGLTVDETVTLTMRGFADLVDALGGVEVTVPRPLPVGGARAGGGTVVEKPVATLGPGRRLLDGHEALWFARSRFDSDDYDRMRRQRCLLGALADQVDPAHLVKAGPGIVLALGGELTTSVDLADLPAWAELLGTVRQARVRSLVLDMPLTDGAPDALAGRAAVAAALAEDPPRDGAAAGGANGTVRAPSAAQDLTDVC